MRKFGIGRRGARVLAGLAVGLAVPAAIFGTGATAQASEWTDYGWTECDDEDAGGCWARSSLLKDGNASNGYYSTVMSAYGEVLELSDGYSDGEPVVAVLWVEGNGSAVYVGEDVHNLSYDEGLEFTVQVCIGSTDGTCGPVQSGTT